MIWRALFYVSMAFLGWAVAGAQFARSETMVASYYGAESGRHTASGARFNPEGFTAAHRTLPFGTRLRVCHQGCVDVVVNDRGPAKWTHRSLDLSKGAARRIGLIARGYGPVQVERVW
jgi:rare lipoprotein A